MPERTGYKQGEPCWTDHSSRDPEAAVSFYSGLFGWEAEDQMPPEAPGHYYMCRVAGRDVAALGSQQAEDAPPMWNTYVAVDSADDAAPRVTEAGGTALGEPFDVFDAGRMAVLMDQAGAPFCIWQANRHIGAQLVDEPGAMVWNELTTRDVDGSKRFYGAVFGWQATPMDMGDFEYTLWHLADEAEPTSDNAIGGMMPMVGDSWPPELPPFWMVYFRVADTDATAVRCEELGGKIASPGFDLPVGRMAVLTDPLGAVFSVLQRAA
jgi:predicted enzyme related to lactoylglutathione lyase